VVTNVYTLRVKNDSRGLEGQDGMGLHANDKRANCEKQKGCKRGVTPTISVFLAETGNIDAFGQ